MPESATAGSVHIDAPTTAGVNNLRRSEKKVTPRKASSGKPRNSGTQLAHSARKDDIPAQPDRRDHPAQVAAGEDVGEDAETPETGEVCLQDESPSQFTISQADDAIHPDTEVNHGTEDSSDDDFQPDHPSLFK